MRTAAARAATAIGVLLGYRIIYLRNPRWQPQLRAAGFAAAISSIRSLRSRGSEEQAPADSERRTIGGGTPLLFALRSKHSGRSRNFQDDFGSNPHSPGTMNTGNIQIDVPAETMVLGGPPPVPSGYFRTIANLEFRTKQGTATLNLATVVKATTGHCTADGLGCKPEPEPPTRLAKTRID